MEILQDIFRKIASFGWPQTFVTAIIDDAACSEKLFHVDFLDKKCLSLSISKSLSYVQILGACFYKLPVVLKIIAKRGGDGLNIISLYLETSSMLANFIYCFLQKNPFTTYGDLACTTLQNIIIISLVWLWGIKGVKQSASHILAVIVASAVAIGLAFYTPAEYQHGLLAYSIVILTFSRIPQILSNFNSKDAGVQSVGTQLLAALGTLVKTFVLVVETTDTLQIAGAVIAAVLNATLLVQVMLLSGAKRDANAAKKEQ